MGPHRFDPCGKLRKLIFDGEEHEVTTQILDKPIQQMGVSWEYHEKNRKNQVNDWVLIGKHVEKMTGNDRDAMTPTVLSKAIGLFNSVFLTHHKIYTE